MSRALRLGVLIALVLVLVAGGAATLAFNGEGPNATRVVELLEEAGVTETAELDELADEFGLGGAVRILWWADAAGGEPSEIAAEIAAMRREGMGWGQIRRALAEDHADFDLGPGIGPVMGGHGQGHGQDQAPGQTKEKGNAPGD